LHAASHSMTGSRDVSFAVKALRSGADDYVLKRFRMSELRERLAIHTEKLKRERERQEMGSQIHGMERDLKQDVKAPILGKQSRATICESIRGRRAFWGKGLLSKAASPPTIYLRSRRKRGHLASKYREISMEIHYSPHCQTHARWLQ